MTKKILTWAIAAIAVVAVIILIVNAKPTVKDESGKPKNDEKAQENLDKSLDSTIESLKTTCATFLTGELNGDPDFDCPGFSESLNTSLCYYCYAVKNQDGSLCGKINNDVALRSTCQKALGLPIDNLSK